MKYFDKGSAIIVAVIVIIVLAIIGGGVWYYLNNRPQGGQFGDWKIYRNAEYSFEMKYPSNWDVLLTASTDKFNPIRIRFSRNTSGGEEYLDVLPNGGPKFSLGPEPSTTTIKILDRNINVEFGQYAENEYDLISLAPFKDSELPMKWGHCAGPYDPCHGFVARISKEKDLELIQNILSTFKFTK